jgi:hypothetical protein
MRRNQKQPLIQVELADYRMLEEVPPQIRAGAGGKIVRLLACLFEFL